jgi:hypothetical protein
MSRKAKEVERVVESIACFECAFGGAKTDEYGETKVTLVAPATSLPEVLKLTGIAAKHNQVTLYAAFQVAHDAD